MTRRANIFHSRTVRLLTGMALLLGLTVVVVSYALIRHQQGELAAGLADERAGMEYPMYSKTDLLAAKREAFGLTLKLSAGVLVLGVLLLFPFLRRISRSMATSAHEHLIPRELMDRELGIAADIQQSLIPAAVTAPKGYEIAYYYQAANEVGGDYIDVIPMENGRVALVMADVAGRGIPSLVVMAMVKVMAHHLILSAEAPSTVVRRINEALIGNMKRNMFVTMFIAFLDCESGRVSISNAGHNPVIVYTHETGEARAFKMDGAPLGTFPPQVFDATVRDYLIELGPGDVLLQYTDGLNESRAQGSRIFGLDRIREAAEIHGKYGADRLVEQLVAQEQHFRRGSTQRDDITLLAVGSAAKTTSRLEESVV